MAKASGFAATERIGKFDPKHVDRILRMKHKQVEQYVGNSRRNWEQRISRGGDLFAKYN